MKLRKQSKKGSTSQNTPVLEKFVVKITNQENTSLRRRDRTSKENLKKAGLIKVNKGYKSPYQRMNNMLGWP